MLDEELSFPTYLGDSIRVRVVRKGTAALTHEQKVRARIAARELRLGVSWNFVPAVIAVQQLHRALLQRDPVFPLDADASLAFQQFIEQRLEDVERGLETGRLLVTEGAFPLLAIQPEPELTTRGSSRTCLNPNSCGATP